MPNEADAADAPRRQYSAETQSSVALAAEDREADGNRVGLGVDPVRATASPRVSVIIPALNEALNIAAAIASARAAETEVIVVDGGSSDNTVARTRGLGVRVLHSPPGRGTQLAAGAAVARGEILVFVHADAQLPPGYFEQVCTALDDPHTVVGAFRLRIAARGAGLRLVEWGVRQRCRWLSMPYGDQGLFMRAETYLRLGGFRALCAMEDIDFVRRAHRSGKVRTLPSTITVSPRAWQRRGVVRFTLWNTFCAAAWFLGVDPERIARWRSGSRGDRNADR